MISISNFKRQHKEIEEIIKGIKNRLEANSLKTDSVKVARDLNTLAGKLRIHLRTEDNVLYPTLQEIDSIEIKRIASSFMEDMTDIAETFMNYKDRFNTSAKILSSIDEFIYESNKVFGILAERIRKEDMRLYPLLETMQS